MQLENELKIAIIGAGNVGASCASLLISRKVCKKVTLIDINKNLAIAKAMDLAQMAAVLNLDIDIFGGDNYELLKDFDIVVITAGFARKDGQSRDDLAMMNAKIVSHSSKMVSKFAPKSIIIVVTNPLDIMVYVAFKESGFARHKVIGMAGELDSARFRYYMSQKLGLNVAQCFGKCVGMHNNSMICLESSIKFKNQSICKDEFKKYFEDIKLNTKNGGSNIVKLMGTSAFFAPAAGVVKMCECIQNDNDETLSCSVLDENLIPTGRLVKLNKNGVQKIFDLNLTNEESKIMDKSISEFILVINKIYFSDNKN